MNIIPTLRAGLNVRLLYSVDPLLRKLHVKKTRVDSWPGGAKKFLSARFSAVKQRFFTQIELRKRTPHEAPVFLMVGRHCTVPYHQITGTGTTPMQLGSQARATPTSPDERARAHIQSAHPRHRARALTHTWASQRQRPARRGAWT